MPDKMRQMYENRDIFNMSLIFPLKYFWYNIHHNIFSTFLFYFKLPLLSSFSEYSLFVFIFFSFNKLFSFKQNVAKPYAIFSYIYYFLSFLPALQSICHAIWFWQHQFLCSYEKVFSLYLVGNGFSLIFQNSLATTG